jgi:hypothetical protein
METSEYKDYLRKNIQRNVQSNEGKIQGFQSKNISGQNNMSLSPKRESMEKINNIKAILSAYIKEKELDM